MRSNDFDEIAPFYDRLARLIFRKSIKKAQTKYLHLIKPGSKILILGGGTGWILKEIIDRQPEVEITYVEKSTRMVELAKTACPNHNIEFVNLPFEECQTEEKFDFIMCNFFLDVFQSQKLKDQIIPKIKSLIAENGGLLVADFQVNQSIWQKMLLWAMHRFFGLFSNMESQKLINLNELLISNKLKETSASYFFKSMIFSRIYKFEQ
ncbi:MAG: ubiquinone/menaquinone biosynthesis C-methylase UbiE [Cyclobacteriaceae bacterium]|jgi:ubiquinone/menaquinone biosynthesis C-methylase UbiE